MNSKPIEQEDQYALTGLTLNQIQELSFICEFFARISIGQIDEIRSVLPLGEINTVDWSAWHEDMREIKDILAKHLTFHPATGSLSIHSENVNKTGQLAWDLHQLVRHRAAWDRAYNDGITTPEQGRGPGMLGVCFDDPMFVALDHKCIQISKERSKDADRY